MKRKQLLALGVAGILSVGSVTSSALAAETTEPNEAVATTENAEETPNEEANENTPEETPAENEGNPIEHEGNPIENDDKTDGDTDNQTDEPSEEEGDTESEAEKLLSDEGNNDGEDTVVTSFEDLKSRIESYTGTDILSLTLDGAFQFEETIEIPEGITVSLTPQSEADTIQFKRKDGFGGLFFHVNGTLMITGTDEKSFHLDGTTTESVIDSFIKVEEGGSLSLTHAALQNNHVTAPGQNGGAITNYGGIILLSDVIIQGNITEGQVGNAIYSTNTVGLKNEVKVDDIFLASNGAAGAGSLYFYDILTPESVVNVRGDGTLESIGSQFIFGESGTDFSKVATRVFYENECYYFVEKEDLSGLVLAASVSYDVLDKQFTRPTENTAEINVAITTESPVTSTSVMYYIIDETGNMAKPDYEQFTKFVSVDKDTDGKTVTLGDVKSFSSNQVIWYYFAEQADGAVVFKDSIAHKRVQTYKLNITSPVVAEVGSNGFKAELTTDAAANGGTCYYMWLSPDDVKGKTGQQVVDEYLKSKKGSQTTVKNGKVTINEKSDTIKSMSGSMRLYCYIENKIDDNTTLKSNVKPSSLMTWTPSILQYETPYYEKDGKTYYDYVTLHLDLAHGNGGDVWIEYIDTKNKAHKANLGKVVNNSFNYTKALPVRGTLQGFEIKSYSIYVGVEKISETKYRKTSNIITPAILPTPTPNVSPTVTPTETPSPMDPGVEKSVFVGLSTPYLSGAKVVFGVMGAGMDNYKPNKGDIRYYPHRWKAAKSPQTIEQVLSWVTSSGTPQGSFTPSSNGNFYASTSKTTGVPEGSYPVTVVFKKQVFDGTQWVDTGSYAKLDKYFQITKDPNKGVHGGDDDGEDNIYEDHGTYYQVLSNGTVVVVTPSIKANAVSDNVIYKVLPDGTRLIRKLKLIKKPADGSSVPEVIYIGDDGKPYDLKEDGSASQLKLSPGAEFEAIDGMIYKVLDDGTIISTGKTSAGDIITDNIIYKVLPDGTKLIRKLKVFKVPEGLTVPDLIYLGDNGKAYQLLADGSAKEVKLPAGVEFEAVDGLIYIVKEDGSVVSTGKNAAGEEVAKNDNIKPGEAAPTGDDTPITYMLSMLALSMLAGGYVLVRRRKKN